MRYISENYLIGGNRKKERKNERKINMEGEIVGRKEERYRKKRDSRHHVIHNGWICYCRNL